MITTTEVWQKFSNKKYRTAFARAQFKRLVPLQIQTLRRQRGWSQQELAEYAKVTQGVVSRSEDQDYGNLTVNTILNIAEGFDVAFVGRFVPFSELDDWYVNLSQETMRVPSFEEENASVTTTSAEDQLSEIEAAQGKGRGDERFGNPLIVFDASRPRPKQSPLATAMEGKQQSTVSEFDLVLLSAARGGGGLAHEAVGSTTR